MIDYYKNAKSYLLVAIYELHLNTTYKLRFYKLIEAYHLNSQNHIIWIH